METPFDEGSSLSNSWPTAFLDANFSFDCVERYYQYHKFLVVDPVWAEILLKDMPLRALKHASTQDVYTRWKKEAMSKQGVCTTILAERSAFRKKIEGFDRNAVMLRGLRLKFAADPVARAELLGTGDTLLAFQGAGSWDHWSVQGQNQLGILLMQVRNELRNGVDIKE